MVKTLLVMGVLNVTPDSFSDGGMFLRPKDAVAHGEALALEGADIIDVGGESTRPGAEDVSLEAELERVIPVIEKLRGKVRARLSIDTRRYEVARAAVAAGATIVNDVSAGHDERMALLGANPKVDFILMHMRGTPKTMQESPSYARGVVTEVAEFLRARVAWLVDNGVAAERIWVDPGIGFGKTFEHNLELLRGLEAMKDIGGRLVIGTSRKAFLGKICEGDRLPGTLASNLWAATRGATVFRVHDVAPLKKALATWEAIDARQ